MKKTICFYFQVHLPSQLRRFRFFDIGNSHNYYDDFNIRNSLQKMAEQCYLPTNKLMLELINQHKNQFRIAFSITGEIIEQMEKYAPAVLDSFKELAATGCVEFLCETYNHSLAFLKDEKEFENQMKRQSALIEKHFGKAPATVRLTGLIYSDQIGVKIANMGFTTMLTEGAKHVLGWKSPNYVYTNNENENLKILLRNATFSDRISYNFSNSNSPEWPVTCEKFASWLNGINENEEVVNLFMDYITFGNRHNESSGIFEFLRCLPGHILSQGKFEFLTPSEVVQKHKSVAPIHVPYPMSWSEEERDLTIWLGNNLQNDAFTALCDLGEKIRFIDDPKIYKDWGKLQDSDHFYYMSTRWQADQSGRRFRNPYNSAYDAYINYMNILSDLMLRVDKGVNQKLDILLKNKQFEEKISKLLNIAHPEFSSTQMKKIIEYVNSDTANRISQENRERAKKKSLSKK